MKKVKRYIISASDSGLCNRLKCLISAMRLSKLLSKEVLLFWPKTFNCGGNFSDLFANKIKEINEAELKHIFTQEEAVRYKNSSTYIDTSYKYHIFDYWRFVLLSEDVPENFAKVFPVSNGKNIDLEFDRISPKLQKVYLHYIRKLSPVKQITKEADNFAKLYGVEKLVGLHVRRTDHMFRSDGRGRVSTDDKFFDRMSELISKNEAKKFFLATDSKETQRLFFKRFGDRVIVFPKHHWEGWDKRAAEESLIDLLLLSKTKHLLGTYLSTFTEMAWWFGGCKAKVEIIGDDKIKKDVLDKSMRAERSSEQQSNQLREFLRKLRTRSYVFRKCVDVALFYRRLL